MNENEIKNSMNEVITTKQRHHNFYFLLLKVFFLLYQTTILLLYGIMQSPQDLLLRIFAKKCEKIRKAGTKTSSHGLERKRNK